MQEAVDDYSKAIAINPNAESSLFNRGASLL